ncbi:unnamed protein product [Sphagnum jensenii]|uniref:Uncharacterized protein n=1 Tax=Sphagnum jensenii TaxID=128206 RepID=A0ABP1AHA3_9BRYO
MAESRRPGVAIIKKSANSEVECRFTTTMATSLLPPQSQTLTGLHQQGPDLPGRRKISIRMLTRQAPHDQEALISELRIRTIKLRRPQSFRKSRRRARKGEEKLGKANRATMDERTSSTSNDHSHRSFRRRSRRISTNV